MFEILMILPYVGDEPARPIATEGRKIYDRKRSFGRFATDGTSRLVPYVWWYHMSRAKNNTFKSNGIAIITRKQRS